MSTESSAAIRDTRRDFMITHREDYLRSGGAKGHIMDLTAVGGTPIGAHCLVRYAGRKSGRTFITPLCYGIVGAEFVIVASKGGADHHPDWYLNIVARPEVDLQVGGQAWRCTWREPEGAERQKIWDHMVDNFAFYANYQASTERTIPVVLLKPVEAIELFKEDDATGVRPL